MLARVVRSDRERRESMVEGGQREIDVATLRAAIDRTLAHWARVRDVSSVAVGVAVLGTIAAVATQGAAYPLVPGLLLSAIFGSLVHANAKRLAALERCADDLCERPEQIRKVGLRVATSSRGDAFRHAFLHLRLEDGRVEDLRVDEHAPEELASALARLAPDARIDLPGMDPGPTEPAAADPAPRKTRKKAGKRKAPRASAASEGGGNA